MKKFRFQWLPVAVVFGGMAWLTTLSGCGSSAPPPAPEVKEAPTEEYIQGEESYPQNN